MLKLYCDRCGVEAGSIAVFRHGSEFIPVSTTSNPSHPCPIHIKMPEYWGYVNDKQLCSECYESLSAFLLKPTGMTWEATGNNGTKQTFEGKL